MTGKDSSRLRLKLPSGLEIEAEGDPDFVKKQLRELLEAAQGGRKEPTRATKKAPPALEAVVRHDGPELKLAALPPGLKNPQEACLILLAASDLYAGQPRPTAAQLARWLRISGIPVKRIDRILAGSLSTGHVLASGSRRSRRYELTAKGRVRGLLAAEKLAQATGKPSSGPA